MAETIHNYEMEFCGQHSIVSTDDHGKIINTALPFHKYEGRNIDEVVHQLQTEKKSFVDMKEIGKTQGRPLVVRGQEQRIN